jgi:6-methylsalicylate decarboxylase
LSGYRVDLHTHFIPAFYREALLAADKGQPDGIPALPPWDVTEPWPPWNGSE